MSCEKMLDVKNVLHVNEMTIATNSKKKKD